MKTRGKTILTVLTALTLTACGNTASEVSDNPDSGISVSTGNKISYVKKSVREIDLEVPSTWLTNEEDTGISCIYAKDGEDNETEVAAMLAFQFANAYGSSIKAFPVSSFDYTDGNSEIQDITVAGSHEGYFFEGTGTAFSDEGSDHITEIVFDMEDGAGLLLLAVSDEYVEEVKPIKEHILGSLTDNGKRDFATTTPESTPTSDSSVTYSYDINEVDPSLITLREQCLEFADSYAYFMNQYLNSDGTDVSAMLSEYTEMENQLTEMDVTLNNVDTTDFSMSDYNYYYETLDLFYDHLLNY